jgi:hypothetical protein
MLLSAVMISDDVASGARVVATVGFLCIASAVCD